MNIYKTMLFKLIFINSFISISIYLLYLYYYIKHGKNKYSVYLFSLVEHWFILSFFSLFIGLLYYLIII